MNDVESGAVVVTELELGKVAVQVLFAAMLVDTLHAALEDAEITFNRVAVDRVVARIHILARTVMHRAVAVEVIARLAVNPALVRH